jgi:hypothetical protein
MGHAGRNAGNAGGLVISGNHPVNNTSKKTRSFWGAGKKQKIPSPAFLVKMV